VEIDLHAKGVDQRMIDLGAGHGHVGEDFAEVLAEHMGLPYHQAAIRATELPKTDGAGDNFSL